jgi:hypothetical protein
MAWADVAATCECDECATAILEHEAQAVTAS